MNSQKLVSVIMSVHNAEKTIEDCVRSILSQTYENIEFLILDDFSTDKTKEILKKLDTESEKIKLYQNNKNLGLTKSLNILIEESKGEYIARQDSDDTSSINRIETQIKTMETDSLDFCTTKARIKGTNKKIPNISYYIPKKILLKYKNPFIHGSLIIKKEALLDCGLYDERFYYSQDYKLMIDLVSKGYKFKIIKEDLYCLNYFDNISINFKEEQQYYANCARKNINPKS